ncbi:hypothetical protein SO694_00015046 [Aureococcus anophagefferens]|uniref:Uncharacterized protein n=1 Tax=Aureococcus anophagefferens TaxID=44056 RepID=A0ABR1G2K1_AURAN
MASVTRKPKIFKKGATPPNLLSTYGAMSPSRKMVNDLRTHLRNAQPAPQQPRGGPRLRESASDPGMAYLGVGGRREARQADEEDDLGPLEFAQLEEVLDEAEHLWRERHHEAERRRQRAVAVTVANAADLFDEDAAAATHATPRSVASAASSAARSVATAASPRTLPSLGNTSVAGLSASPSRRPRVADTRPRERPKMSTSGLGDMLSERRSAAQRATKDRALRAALRSGEGIDVAARGPIDTYVASFAREKEIFASGSVYALAKLDEATQLASTGLMPTCVLAAVAVHLLLEELPSLGHVRRPLAALVRAIFAIPQAHHALIAGDTEAAAAYRGKTKRRRSLFVASEIAQELMDLRGGAAQDNLDTCATARQRYLGGVLAQYLAKITDDAGGDGGDADRPELRLMAHVPTWGELRSLFEARRNAELSTKASVETRLSKLVREKEQVVQFVEGLCDKRSVTAMAITFERWRTHKKQEKRKAALARALLAMQANGGAIDAPRSLFTAWRRAVVAATQRRARQRARDVARVVRESREQGSKRVIQRRFNVSIPRARVPETASALRDRSKR